MDSPAPGTSLRPLGLGEILDRAVTVCVRNISTLSLIYAAYAIPAAIATYFASRDLQRVLEVFVGAMQTKGNRFDPDALTRALNRGGLGGNPWSLVELMLSVFALPLPTAALIEATTAFYLGRATSFAQAYRVAFARYGHMLGVTLLFVLSGGALYFVLVVALVFVFFVLALATTAAPGLGVAIGVIVALAIGLPGLAIVLLALLALQVAYFTCVVERANMAGSFVRSLKRTLVGVGLRRSLSVGLVYLAIYVGISVVTLAGQFIFLGLVKSAIVGTAYATLVRVATAAFMTAFVGIFYIDLRVREEGLDLQLVAERVAPPATVPL